MANPKSTEAKQAYIDKNPFEGMHISDNTLLSELKGRHPCTKCGKSRKFYCYSCYVPIAELQGKLPVVKLPLKIDIIKHQREIDGKSTSAHAAILAPGDVRVYTYPHIPDYTKERAVLVYPSHDAMTISQLVSEKNYEKIQCLTNNFPNKLPKGYNKSTLLRQIPREENTVAINNNNLLPIDKVVFIDSTWNQSKGIYKDEKISSIPCVVIENRISQFWRHQKGSPRWYLATIEAIHQLLLEVHIHLYGLSPHYKGIVNCFSEKSINFELLFSDNQKAYNGQYDNLLYFFKHMYDLIHSYYTHEDLYAYKRRLM